MNIIPTASPGDLYQKINGQRSKLLPEDQVSCQQCPTPSGSYMIPCMLTGPPDPELVCPAVLGFEARP